MTLLLVLLACGAAMLLGEFHGRTSERRKSYDATGKPRSAVSTYAELEGAVMRQKGLRMPHPDPENAPRMRKVRTRV